MPLLHEHVQLNAGSSFRVLTDSLLPDVFFWHYHAEYELQYLHGANGIRHVGQHFSRYEGGDLVLTGPQVPHLNVDYGVSTDYEKVVVQFPDSLRTGLLGQLPEMAAIAALLERSRAGIAFHGRTKELAGAQLGKLAQLPPFEGLLALLQLLQQLATSTEYTLLHPAAATRHPEEQQRLEGVTRLVREHYGRRIELSEAAAQANLTPGAFCRAFKRLTRQTFTQFLNQYRVHQAQRLLLQGHTVSEACVACGFESLSYFTKIFRHLTGENPLQFKKRHAAGGPISLIKGH